MIIFDDSQKGLLLCHEFLIAFFVYNLNLSTFRGKFRNFTGQKISSIYVFRYLYIQKCLKVDYYFFLLTWLMFVASSLKWVDYFTILIKSIVSSNSFMSSIWVYYGHKSHLVYLLSFRSKQESKSRTSSSSSFFSSGYCTNVYNTKTKKMWNERSWNFIYFTNLIHSSDRSLLYFNNLLLWYTLEHLCFVLINL